MKTIPLIAMMFLLGLYPLGAQVEDNMKDTLQTGVQPVQIELLGHASLRLQFGSVLVYVDPVMEFYKPDDFGKVDLILVTHSHRDHLQPDLIDKLKNPTARVFIAQDCAGTYPDGQLLKNGEESQFGDMRIKAVPAYNIVHKRENGEPFHATGMGNGYVLKYGGKGIYVAGDTENIPEMKELVGIDVAFLPTNLPYTMDADMFMAAVELLQPGKVYPYHYKFGNSVLSEIIPRMTEKHVSYKAAGK